MPILPRRVIAQLAHDGVRPGRAGDLAATDAPYSGRKLLVLDARKAARHRVRAAGGEVCISIRDRAVRT